MQHKQYLKERVVKLGVRVQRFGINSMPEHQRITERRVPGDFFGTVMKNSEITVVLGAQWGDEGKGKITDYMATSFDIVARFSGGNNAGHTVLISNEKFKLHHIPSGIFYPEKLCILGNGMVIDPEVLMSEIEGLRKRGIPCDNIRISDRAHITMPYHIWLDELQETLRNDQKLGTTKRGIGPVYMDKVSRSGIRAIDLVDKEVLREKIAQNFRGKAKLLKGSNFTIDGIFKRYSELAESLKNYITDTSLLLYEAIRENKKIMLEGAQGALLDLDFGTYPFVTSSNSIAGNASTGTGIPPYMITNVVGVAKAYTTRIGTGPFPSELKDCVGEHLLKVGAEYGTTTGRPRRCGWLDLVVLKFAQRINGINCLALSKLDVLTNINPISLAVNYRHNGKNLDNFPASIKILSQCEPVYIELEGWTEDITVCSRFEDLPIQAQNFIKKIEEILDVPVEIISVGPERNQTIEVKKSKVTV